MNAAPRPIGYWLKRLDRTIEDGFERDLARWSLTRRHWQVLNALSGGPASESTLAHALAAFWVAGAITQQEVVGDLLSRSWAETSDRSLTLTPAGLEAHSRVSAQVSATRAKLLDGLRRRTTPRYCACSSG